MRRVRAEVDRLIIVVEIAEQGGLLKDEPNESLSEIVERQVHTWLRTLANELCTSQELIS
jgi:ABC-type antimicrobial peptide transport system ATPase subunit